MSCHCEDSGNHEERGKGYCSSRTQVYVHAIFISLYYQIIVVKQGFDDDEESSQLFHSKICDHVLSSLFTRYGVGVKVGDNPTYPENQVHG